jgi:hypothetical protein
MRPTTVPNERFRRYGCQFLRNRNSMMERPMIRFTTLVFAGFIALGSIGARSALSQQSTTQARTRVIVASFNKHKHVVKEKRGVRMEKYKEVRSVPAIKADPRDYSGSYEVEGVGFYLDLRVDADGKVTGGGYDPVDFDAHMKRQFTLRNARIDGALLSGTKVYAGGVTKPLEGAFINSTSFESPTDKGVTTFGLGVIGNTVSVSDFTIPNLFYKRQD